MAALYCTKTIPTQRRFVAQETYIFRVFNLIKNSKTYSVVVVAAVLNTSISDKGWKPYS